MARRVDEVKLLGWKKRLAKFESSDLSVAAFCRQQKIAPTQFYYWERRVREACQEGQRVSGDADTKTARSVVDSWAEVFVGDSVRVRVPQDPRLIGALVRELQSSLSARSSFERIDLVSSQ